VRCPLLPSNIYVSEAIMQFCFVLRVLQLARIPGIFERFDRNLAPERIFANGNKVYSRLMNKQPKAQGLKRQRQDIVKNFEYGLDRLDPLRSISRKCRKIMYIQE
jgi:hypothetical protein